MDNKQIIIAIGREYGAGGHSVANELVKKYKLPIYDSNMLEKIAEEKSVNPDDLKKYDEKPKNRLFSRTLDGHSSSPEDIVAQMEFEFLKKKSESGESFIVIGRCASSLLRDNPNTISIFINADMPDKIKRMSKILDADGSKAEMLIMKNNRKRKAYHNFYCKEKWGDSRNYELSINSSRIGIENTAAVIEKYIESRINS